MSDAKKRQRLKQAAADYHEAARIAEERGWSLIRHSDHHFTLRDPSGGVLNLWPSTQQYRPDDKRQPMGHPVHWGERDWRLVDFASQFTRMIPERPPALNNSAGLGVVVNNPKPAKTDWTLYPIPLWITCLIAIAYYFVGLSMGATLL